MNGANGNGFYTYLVGGLVVLLIIFMATAAFVEIINIATDPELNIDWGDTNATDPAAKKAQAAAEQALKEADRTSDSLGLLLSLLQGGAVLGGLALGATAYLGLRNYNRLQEEATSLLKQLTEKGNVLDQTNQTSAANNETFKEWEGTFKQWEREKNEITSQLKDLKQQSEKIATDTLVSTELMEVYQDYNLKNYQQAYKVAQSLLHKSSENPHILYIAGWMEVQHISHELDAGVKHLEQAVKERPDWPNVRAAYGVALRRQSRDAKNKRERLRLLNDAADELEKALNEDFYLLDPKRESFWTPLAGIYRDIGELALAIKAFQNARRVTPYSSYPIGNLANLYLQQAAGITGDQRQNLLDEALNTFEKTCELAEKEMTLNPDEYYQIMDIAMARLMLGQRHPDDPAYFGKVFETLNNALRMGESTIPMLDVSLTGWRNLDAYCPQEWVEVKQKIAEAIQIVERAKDDIAAKESEQAEKDRIEVETHG